MESRHKKKYFLHVYGCQMNVSDAERMETLLDRLGFEKTDKEAGADLVGVVACSVRQAPIDRIYGQANKWQQMKKDHGTVTMLSGCVLDHDKPNMSKIFDVMFPIKELGAMPKMLSDHFGSSLLDGTPALDEYFDVVPKYDSEFRAFVPISSGCNKFCTYCAVPYTRGGEISRAPDKILDEVRHLVQRGYKEVTLLGQNVNSYGLDFEGIVLNLPERKVLKYKQNVAGELEVVKRHVENPMNFSQLLQAIDEIPGDFWVRFVTSHPFDMSDELIETVANGRTLTHYIHLPVQAGSDNTLKRMNRLYTVDHYKGRLAKVRKLIPDAYVTTDIIAGFSGETEADFQGTGDLMRDARYDMGYIAQYSPREGTVGARMDDDIAADEKLRRHDVLNKILEATAFENNRSIIGTLQRMLVEEWKNNKNIGRLKNGRKAHFIGGNRVGHFVDVKVVDATPWHVLCEPL